MPKPLIQSYYFLLLSPCSCFAKYFYAMNKVFKNPEEIRRNDHHEVLAHVLQATETKAYILKWPSVSVTEGWEAAAALRGPSAGLPLQTRQHSTSCTQSPVKINSSTIKQQNQFCIHLHCTDGQKDSTWTYMQIQAVG